jgi:hypothetical protein
LQGSQVHARVKILYAQAKEFSVSATEGTLVISQNNINAIEVMVFDPIYQLCTATYVSLLFPSDELQVKRKTHYTNGAVHAHSKTVAGSANDVKSSNAFESD